MTSVTLPASVESIRADVFYNCTKLTNVYYFGSETDWGKMSVGKNNDYLINAQRHYTAPTTTQVTELLNEIAALNSQTLEKKTAAVKTIGASALRAALQQSESAVEALGKLEGGGAAVSNTASGVTVRSIIGAGLNASGGGAVTLTITPGTQQTLPSKINGTGAIFMNMTLTGVTNASALDVPVCVTFKVPTGMTAQRVRLVHYGDETEILTPSVYTEEGVSYVRFVLDGFSPFALAEINRIPGDMNNDGKVDSEDVLKLLKYVAHVEGIDLSDCGDVDGDGKIDSTDVLRLLKAVAGIEVVLY